MISLIPVLLGRANADPMALLKGMLAGSGTYSADVQFGEGQFAVARGTVISRADGAMIVRSGSERIVHGPAGDGEFDSATQTFDVAPRIGPLNGTGIGTGRLANRARAIVLPPMSMRGRFGRMPFKRSGQGRAYTAKVGQADYSLVFDAANRIVRYEISTPMERFLWIVRDFKAVPTPPASEFAPTIPKGWVEYLEPYLPEPVQPGVMLPAAYRNRAPSGKGTWLLAVLDGGPASSGAAAWLDQWKGVPVATLSDPTEADRRALGAERVPMFVLVGRDGKVRGVWQGYAPDMEAALQKEIGEAADQQATGE